MSALFLIVCIALTSSAWLRPPLSPDLSGFRIPLGITTGIARSPEEILYGKPRFLPDSAAGLLLVLVITCGAVVVIRPRWLPAATGILLCGAVCASADVVLNHPALIELLDFEQEQREQMAAVTLALDGTSMTSPSNGRVDGTAPGGVVSDAPVVDDERADLGRGLAYLRHGDWLIAWSLLGVYFSAPGRFSRRMAILTLWGLLAIGLACGTCSRRILAEFYWSRAKSLEARCEFPASRAALDLSFWYDPEFAHLERTWLLVGEIDFRERRATPYRQFFLASRYASNNDWPRANALMRDLRATVSDRISERQRSRFLVETGLACYRQNRLMAAEDFWRGASRLAPSRWDARFLVASLAARIDRDHPERTEAELEGIEARISDRSLRADLLSSLGDAYLEAGRMGEARGRFARSCDVFCFPQNVPNYRATKRLGGF